MSAARVLNPVVLTELCKIGASPASCGRQLKRIKRDLFGPVNPLEINKLLNEEIEKQQERAKKKWSFDFCNGAPVQSRSSQFLWQRISCQESTFTPEVYTLTRAAHVRPNLAPAISSMELLMDERAERENNSLNLSSATDTDSCDELHDDSNDLVFKVPAVVHSAGTPRTLTIRCSRSQARKRQPKITEFMKERKRLAQTAKKISPPAKRLRTSSGSSSAEPVITRAAHAQQLSTHYQLRK